MDSLAKTLESILVPEVFIAILEFLDDTAISYLKQLSTSYNTQITAQQNSNAYWKTRVQYKFQIPLGITRILDWYHIYKIIKSVKLLIFAVIEIFPPDLTIAYIKHSLEVANKLKVNSLGITIYNLILKFDRIDVYDSVRDLLGRYTIISNSDKFADLVIKSPSSEKILLHIIPEIIKIRNRYTHPNYIEYSILRFLDSAVKSTNINNFMLLDTWVVPKDFKSHAKVLHIIIIANNLNILKYYFNKYPEEMQPELSRNLDRTLMELDPEYSMAVFIISEVSDVEYLKFLRYLPYYSKISPTIWKAMAMDPRVSKEFTEVSSRPEFYLH